MITGNKGEWSEIYAFLKLLSEGKLHAADEDLNRIPGIFYPIMKIIREEVGGKLEYIRDVDVSVFDPVLRSVLIKVPLSEFSATATSLLSAIRGNSSSFSVPEVEDFMGRIYCAELKSRSSDKSDITIMVHDIYTNLELILGFSIKSMLGGASTLLNAGNTTNFIYKIKGGHLDSEGIGRINSISSRPILRNRLSYLKENNYSLEFARIHSTVFELNLRMIDSSLPEIIAECLLIYYSTGISSVIGVLEEIYKRNPLRFNPEYSHSYYEHKIKNFLTDVALGMTPSSVWNGIYDATGGYIIVKEDGDVVCYHVYNQNELQNYLLKNTRFETASTERYNFGKIYLENGQPCMNLNLQVRFLR
ncbi:HpaII family restriction endonuclease [Chloroflexota bacterium]